MQRYLRSTAWAAVLVTVALGCTKPMTQQPKHPPDPLLISKKPVEGKPTALGERRQLTRVDPQPPAYPGLDGAPARLSSEVVVKPNP